MMNGLVYYPPAQPPTNREMLRLLGCAHLKREGYVSDYETGLSVRGDVIEEIAKMLMKKSRLRKFNLKNRDKLMTQAFEIIKYYENEKAKSSS